MAKDTGRGVPVASVDVRRIGGGNSPPELWLRVRRGKGTLIIEAFGEAVAGSTTESKIVSSAISSSSSQTRAFFLRVNSNGPAHK